VQDTPALADVFRWELADSTRVLERPICRDIDP